MKKTFTPLLLFCLGSLLLFFPILGRTFAADDFQVVKRVGLDKNLLLEGFFRPLSDVTLYVNHMLGGWSPVGYYLFNILLHGINSFLVFLFCLRWKWTDDQKKQQAYALTAGLFFLAYPFHSEGIDWVIGRGASLATFFGLAALVVLLGSRRPATKMAWVAVLYFAGMAAYEPVILLPPLGMLVLYVCQRPRKEMFRWGMVFCGTFLLHFLVRMMISGGVSGEYGREFLSHGWLYYAGNAGKATGRLFLPPGEGTRTMLLAFLFVLAGLTAGLLVFYRRTKDFPVRRIYLGALLLQTGITCILPVVTAVSTRTSESDRLLYFPSVFLCCALSFLLVILTGTSLRLKVAVLLVMGYMLVFLEKGNLNWMQASGITRDILTVTSRQPAGGKLFVINLPDEKDGAFIFRLGFPEALLLGGRDTAGLVVVNHLKREQWLVTPDSISVERTGGQIHIAPEVTIRQWTRDSLQIETGSVLAGERREEGHCWLAGKADRILYWNKKALVELEITFDGSGLRISR